MHVSRYLSFVFFKLLGGAELVLLSSFTTVFCSFINF